MDTPWATTCSPQVPNFDMQPSCISFATLHSPSPSFFCSVLVSILFVACRFSTFSSAAFLPFSSEPLIDSKEIFQDGNILVSEASYFKIVGKNFSIKCLSLHSYNWEQVYIPIPQKRDNFDLLFSYFCIWLHYQNFEKTFISCAFLLLCSNIHACSVVQGACNILLISSFFLVYRNGGSRPPISSCIGKQLYFSNRHLFK